MGKTQLKADEIERMLMTEARKCRYCTSVTQVIVNRINPPINNNNWSISIRSSGFFAPFLCTWTITSAANRLQKDYDVAWDDQQPEAVNPPSSPLARAEQHIGDVTPRILLDSELEDIIEAAINKVYESNDPLPEISPEADKAMRELAKLFGSDPDDEPAKTPPDKKPK